MPPSLGRPHQPRRRWSEQPSVVRLAVEGVGLVLAAAATAALPSIPQPSSYHRFAGDHRQLGPVPHAANVLSNIAIAVPGVVGLWRLVGHWRRKYGAGRGTEEQPGSVPWRMPAAEVVCWAATCGGMVAAAAGSAWYHLGPSNASLAWDRLGMAATFGGLLAAVLAERRSRVAGLVALPLLELGAVASMGYWQASEAVGNGDLRWYLLLQGGTAAAVLYHCIAYPAQHASTRSLLATLALYSAAVACDRLDWPLYWVTLSAVSGHTLKHLLAGVAGWQLVRMLQGDQRKRQRQQ